MEERGAGGGGERHWSAGFLILLTPMPGVVGVGQRHGRSGRSSEPCVESPELSAPN